MSTWSVWVAFRTGFLVPTWSPPTAEVLAGRASPGVTEPAKSEYDGPEPRRWRLKVDFRQTKSPKSDFARPPARQPEKYEIRNGWRTDRSDAIFAIFGAGYGPLVRAECEISGSGDIFVADIFDPQNPLFSSKTLL